MKAPQSEREERHLHDARLTPYVINMESSSNPNVASQTQKMTKWAGFKNLCVAEKKESRVTLASVEGTPLKYVNIRTNR